MYTYICIKLSGWMYVYVTMFLKKDTQWQWRSEGKELFITLMKSQRCSRSLVSTLKKFSFHIFFLFFITLFLQTVSWKKKNIERKCIYVYIYIHHTCWGGCSITVCTMRLQLLLLVLFWFFSLLHFICSS